VPNRIVREAILTSERVASLGWPEEVFYRRLMSIVDDYGRTEANHQLLRSKCYPLQTDQVRAADIARWMAACQKAGVILCYEVGGKQYLEVLNFGQQQRSASKCPPPPSVDSNCLQPQADAHLVVSVSGVVSEDVKTRSRATPPDGVSVSVWEDYLKTRKSKMTDTALAGLRREAGKAGLTLQKALETACERGWRGFKAEWVTDSKQQAGRHTDDASDTRRMLDQAKQGTKPPDLATLARLAELRRAA
jgi:hypothetical protein